MIGIDGLQNLKTEKQCKYLHICLWAHMNSSVHTCFKCFDHNRYTVKKCSFSVNRVHIFLFKLKLKIQGKV